MPNTYDMNGRVSWTLDSSTALRNQLYKNTDRHYQPYQFQRAILNNIKFFNKKDIYCDLLFKKAASCYHLMRYDEAVHILRELIKIDPYNDMNIRFLNKCMLRKKPKFVRSAQAVSVIFFLISALIISIELIVIRPLYEMHSSSVEFYRNTFFLMGVFILGGTEVLNRLKVRKKIQKFVAESKKRKVIK